MYLVRLVPLLPIFFNDTQDATRSTSLFDRNFGLDWTLDDFFSPTNFGLVKCPPGYDRPWCFPATRANSGVSIVSDKDKFQVNLDVQQFKPEEVSVKVTGKDTITVEGKHEEKQDDHGFISRHFIRRYVLPEGHDINNVVSSLSSDGILSITAPRVEQPGIEERNIPIQQTGVPAKPIESNKVDNEKQESKPDDSKPSSEQESKQD